MSIDGARPTVDSEPAVAEPLSPELLQRMDAYWRAANYVSVGQLYLYANPLLRRPLELSHVKPLVVGHWGTSMRTRTRPAVARTPGRSTAPAAWPGADVRSAARPAAERLAERIM